MKLYLRLLVGTATLFSAAACGGASMFGSGEAFGLGFVNFGKTTIEQVRIDGVGNDKNQYDGHSLVRPFLGKPPAFANVSTLQDTNKKIPDQVSITWQEFLGENVPANKGKLFGPFVVDVRSRIPKKVLQLATKRKYGIGIGLAINNGPITTNWGLFYSGERGVESNYLCVGGDYFTASGQTTFRPFGLLEEAKSIGVWPNCKLP